MNTNNTNAQPIIQYPVDPLVFEPRDFFCWRCSQHYSLWVKPGDPVVVRMCCGLCGELLTALQDEPPAK